MHAARTPTELAKVGVDSIVSERAKISGLLFAFLLAFGTLASTVTVRAATPDYLQICLGKAADDSPVYATDVLPDQDVIFACFRIHRDVRFSKITGTLIAVDVGSVAPPNYVVASTDFQPQAMDTAYGDFKFSLPRPFPAGKYRVDVTCDGQPWKSVAFTIAAPSADSGPARDVMPLGKGSIWNYNFVQQIGAAGKQTDLPGAKPGPDGKVYDTVQMVVVGVDEGVSHIEIRAAGQLFAEEWWRKTGEGVTTMQRKGSHGKVVIDPPELIVRQPPLQAQSWDYVSKDGGIHKTMQQWGPVRIHYGQGERPGYIVLIEEQGSPSTTIEQEYIPGIGMVHSVQITGKDGETIDRQELTLNQ